MKKLLSIAIFALFCALRIFAMEDQNSTALLRVMTYNIRRDGKEETPERLWHNRRPLVAEILNSTSPDIIGFQEPIKSQVRDLETLLPHFKQFGEGRGTSWWGLGDDEYNPIFYNAKKFELLDCGTFFINKLNSLFGWMPWHAWQTGWLPRICTWGKFKNKETAQEFYVYNTHFDHMFPAAQLLCARNAVKDIKKRTDNLPVIVMGDFNTPFSGRLKEIFNAFTHVRELAQTIEGPQDTRTGWSNNELKWIDHILVNKPESTEVLRYEVIARDDYPSDHRPVIADIALKNN